MRHQRTTPATILLLGLLLPGAAVLATDAPNLGETIAAQQNFLEEEPGNAVAWNDLANLLVEAGLYREAEGAYRRSISLDPGNASARFNLSVLLFQSGRAQEAEKEVLTLLQDHPSHAWGHYQLGVLLAARSERREALEHYARALALDPLLSFADNNPHILDNPLFGEALLLSQRYAESLANKVPRQYGDPYKIRSLMLGEEVESGENGVKPSGENGVKPSEAVEADPEGTPRADAVLPAGQPRPAGSAAPGGRPAPAASASPQGGAPSTGGLRPSHATPTTVNPGRPFPPGAEERQIRPSQPAPSGSTANRAPMTSGRRLNPATAVPEERERQREGDPRQAAPPPPPRRSGSRYIAPTRRSTAQLELRLLDEETG